MGFGGFQLSSKSFVGCLESGLGRGTSNEYVVEHTKYTAYHGAALLGA